VVSAGRPDFTPDLKFRSENGFGNRLYFYKKFSSYFLSDKTKLGKSLSIKNLARYADA
jgi:hypothetical protein